MAPVELETAEPAQAVLGDGVSVIVPSYRGARRITALFRSLTAQTLESEQFETIVVLNGEPDGTRPVVERYQRDHGHPTVRLLEVAEAGVSLARNAGLSIASRRHVTFIDDDDEVSPGYLETLLGCAAPGVIPLAQIMDIHGAGRSETATPINLQTIPYAGQVVHPDQVPRGLGFNACKLVPTEVARSVRYDTGLTSGVDVAYFMTLLARHDIRIRVCPIDSGPDARNAVYYRSVRPDSVSRQGPSFDFHVVGRMEVIARIDALARACADERRRWVMRTTIRSQVGHIGRYLAAQPDDLERVLRTVESYQIEDFPHHLLMRARRAPSS